MQAKPRAWPLRGARWWGLLAGLLIGALDAAGMAQLGVTFEMNGADVWWPVAAYFGSSFALLGFLLGHLAEGRQRDREKAAIIQEQLQAIDAVRARLAQSEKLAALGQLAAAIAHEVRNPLAVIRSAAQGLGETAANEQEARRACSFITDEIDRLSTVSNTLLAFARPLSVAPQAIGVDGLFDRALLLARNEVAAKDIRVQRGDAAGLPLVHADPDLLSQVLLGLLSNATAATPPGGRLQLEATAAADTVEIAVSDSGPGIPEDLRARVFEPFFTTRARGTGLGLAVARQIVEAHGGRIDVGDSALGGARFRVRLPAAMAAAATA